MVFRTMRYRVLSCGDSDIGLVRQNNEDCWAAVPEVNFYALADGMGGHRAGEVASKQAVTYLCRLVKNQLASPEANGISLEELHGIIQLAIEKTNDVVYQLGRTDHELRGMGTTLCCLCFHPTGLVCANVGDSRVYRLRRKILDQMTKDHSLLSDLLDLGQLDEKQAAEFLYKNIITKAIGTEATVDPSVHILDLETNDVYLMCSDGLTDLLSLAEIQEVMNKMKSLEATTKELIQIAKARGGYDNVTVVLVSVEEIA